jgi:hypothetical protein
VNTDKDLDAATTARKWLKDRYIEVFPSTVDLMWSVVNAQYEGQSPSDADVVSALRLVERARADQRYVEHQLITAARSRGVTWTVIAEALELESPQAAQRRAKLVSPTGRQIVPATVGSYIEATTYAHHGDEDGLTVDEIRTAAVEAALSAGVPGPITDDTPITKRHFGAMSQAVSRAARHKRTGNPPA